MAHTLLVVAVCLLPQTLLAETDPKLLAEVLIEQADAKRNQIERRLRRDLTVTKQHLSAARKGHVKKEMTEEYDAKHIRGRLVHFYRSPQIKRDMIVTLHKRIKRLTDRIPLVKKGEAIETDEVLLILPDGGEENNEQRVVRLQEGHVLRYNRFLKMETCWLPMVRRGI